MAFGTKKTSTTKLPKAVRDELGLKDTTTPSSRKGKKALGRKERRRHERELKKLQRQQKPQVIHQPPPPGTRPLKSILKKTTTTTKPAPAREEVRPLKSILKKTRPVEHVTEGSGGDDGAQVPHVRRAVRDQLEKNDAEIEYLEKKLNIKGKKKLPKAFEEDGLDFLMEGLDEDFAWGERKKKRKGKDAVPALYEGTEDEEMGSDGDGLGDGSGGGSDEDMDEGQDTSDEDQELTDAEEPETPTDTEPPQISQPSKYIPPSLRKAQAPESENLVFLRRRCHGILNRLSEANLTSTLSEVEDLYSANPRADVTSTLSNLLITIVGDPSVLMDTFMILHAGFVAGLYKLIGTDFGAHIVQAVIEDFDAQYERVNRINDPATAGKKCTNLVSFIAEMYNLQVVGAVIVFDLLRMFLGEITELNTELLLKVAKGCGHQLRKDDPAALKDIVSMMQPAITKVGYPSLSIRTKFMIETLTNLRNNRLKSATASSVVVSEATVRMKRLLGALNMRQIRASEPLRVSLADIRNTDAKGKWWLVGASWAGNQASNATASDINKSAEPLERGTEDTDFHSSTDLLQLARQQRMNTDIRQAIFVAIMSAEDYTDAHNRIIKLRLKRKQEPEIPRVLIHCCGSEASYNPYYTLVARKLCGQNSIRMSFTFTLWGVFRQMGEDDGGGEGADPLQGGGEGEQGPDMRKILNLSRMYGTLIAEGVLGLDVLKILDLAYLQAKTKTFLELLFITIFLQTLDHESATSEEALARVFLRIRENQKLVRGTLFFLKRHVKGTNVMGGKAKAAIVACGIRRSCDLLETFVAKDTLGE